MGRRRSPFPSTTTEPMYPCTRILGPMIDVIDVTWPMLESRIEFMFIQCCDTLGFVGLTLWAVCV